MDTCGSRHVHSTTCNTHTFIPQTIKNQAMTTCIDPTPKTDEKLPEKEVIGWGLPSERLFAAAVGGRGVWLHSRNKIETTHLNPDATQVYVIGTYFDDIAAVREVCKDAKVTHIVHGPEDAKRYESDVATTMDQILPIKEHPWMMGVLRRSGPKGTAEDKAFHRGLFFKLKQQPAEDGYAACISGEWDPEEIKITGAILAEASQQSAEFDVQMSAIPIKVCGLQGNIVQGGWSNVVPVAKAAAAVGEGVDVGINVRYNLKTNSTHFSFARAHDGVDLSFVERPPFNVPPPKDKSKRYASGGGQAHFKGCTIPGVVVLTPNLPLEDCVRITQPVSIPLK